MGERKVTQGLIARIAIGVFGLLTVAMILLAIFDERGALALNKRRNDLNRLHQEINGATEQNENYEKEIQALRHDKKEIERRARERLKLVKPGETVLEVPDAETPSPSDQPVESK